MSLLSMLPSAFRMFLLCTSWLSGLFLAFTLQPSILWKVLFTASLAGHTLLLAVTVPSSRFNTLSLPLILGVGVWQIPVGAAFWLLRQTFLAWKNWEPTLTTSSSAQKQFEQGYFWILFVTGLCLLSLLAVLWPYTVDDAFYTFQHGRHFLAGHGFVFFPGQRVEGFSSPLWAFLLACLEWLTTISMHHWSKILGALLSLGIPAVMLWRFLHWKQTPQAPVERLSLLGIATVPVVWLLLQPGYSFFAITGLETILAAFLITSSLYWQCQLWSQNKESAGPYLPMAFLAVTRPEAPMFLFLLFVVRWTAGVRENGSGSLMSRFWLALKQEFWPAFFAGLVPLTWMVYRFVFYQDIFPNPYYAKTGQFWRYPSRSLLVPWEFLKFEVFGYKDYLRVCNHQNQSLLPCFQMSWLWGWKMAWVARGLILGSLSILALRGVFHPKTRMLAFRLFPFVFGICYFLLHGAMNSWMKHTRFVQPYLPILLLLPFLGLWSLSPKWRIRVSVFLLLLLPVKATSPWVFAQMMRGNHIVDHSHRSDNLIKMSRWLQKNLPKNSSILLSEVGAMAYYSKLKMVDEAGITDREVAKLLSKGNFNHYPLYFDLKKNKAWYRDKKAVFSLLLKRRPEYIILHTKAFIPLQDYQVSLQTTPRLEWLKYKLFVPHYRFVRGFWQQPFKRFLLFERLSAKPRKQSRPTRTSSKK